MTLGTARAACVAIVLAAGARVDAASLTLRPLDTNPPQVAALAADGEIEAFALAPAGSMAVVSLVPQGEAGVSTLRYARGTEEPRLLPLPGKLVGLAVTADGATCYAVVRVSGRKGVVRSVDLVRIDLRAGRAISVVSLPASAAGLAITSDGSTVLVASKDEIRTFAIPAVASGRLYRTVGDNVGAFPVEGSSYAVVVQRSRIGLVDLAAPQDRDGLALRDEMASPAPLHGLLASAGEGGPVILGEGGLAWRVGIGELPAAPAVPPPDVAPPPVAPAAAAAQVPSSAAEITPAPTSPPPPPVPEPSPAPASADATPPAPVPTPVPAEVAPREIEGRPGTVSGVVTGPAAAEVAEIVFLGPDNILKEALRVTPDASGRYGTTPLAEGSYRIVAVAKGGRVLICSPPYISLRVGSNSAVEAPELTVLRAR